MAIDLAKFRYYVKLDELSGTRFDSSSHANDLITASGTSNAVPAKINDGLQFTTTNAYMQTAASASLGLGPIDFTIWGWWSNDTPVVLGQYDMVNKSGADAYLLECARVGSSSTMHWHFGHALTPSGNATIDSVAFTPDSDLHFVMLEHVIATKTFNLYIDDVTTPNATLNYLGTLATATSDVLQMGLPSGLQAPTFDEVAIYAGLLTQDDKNCVFNGGNGGTYPDFCDTAVNFTFDAEIDFFASFFSAEAGLGSFATSPTLRRPYLAREITHNFNIEGTLPQAKQKRAKFGFLFGQTGRPRGSVLGRIYFWADGQRLDGYVTIRAYQYIRRQNALFEFACPIQMVGRELWFEIWWFTNDVTLGNRGCDLVALN